MKNNNIVHWTIKIGWEDGTEEYIADIPDWVAKPVDEFLGEIEREKREEEPELPDGLQKYIDGVALNILYSNYHKGINGIWCKAEVDEEMDDEWMGQDEYYVVNIDFGCQDDTRNEQYRERMDVWSDKETGEWTCEYPKEDPADKDDRLYKEEQDHIAMEKAKETK